MKGQDTDEMIAHSAQLNFAFELVMSKNLPTNSIQSRIHDFSVFPPTLVDFDLCNSFREACNEFFGIIIYDRRQDLDCGQQSVRCRGCLVRLKPKRGVLPTGENLA